MEWNSDRFYRLPVFISTAIVTSPTRNRCFKCQLPSNHFVINPGRLWSKLVIIKLRLQFCGYFLPSIPSILLVPTESVFPLLCPTHLSSPEFKPHCSQANTMSQPVPTDSNGGRRRIPIAVCPPLTLLETSYTVLNV